MVKEFANSLLVELDEENAALELATFTKSVQLDYHIIRGLHVVQSRSWYGEDLFRACINRSHSK